MFLHAKFHVVFCSDSGDTKGFLMPGIFKNGKKVLSISENSHKFSKLHNNIIVPRLKTKEPAD